MLFSILFPTALGLSVSSAVYTIGTAAGLGGMQMMTIVYLSALALLVIVGLYSGRHERSLDVLLEQRSKVAEKGGLIMESDAVSSTSALLGSSSGTLWDVLLVGFVMLVALIYLYRKLWTKARRLLRLHVRGVGVVLSCQTGKFEFDTSPLEKALGSPASHSDLAMDVSREAVAPNL